MLLISSSLHLALKSEILNVFIAKDALSHVTEM